jgi:4-amino-4-deoxy-L-arabinose transferase-like glycosyltransferase
MKKSKSIKTLIPKGVSARMWILLIVLAAIWVRMYHIDYPAIGYHNVKENFYIGMAKFMLADGDFIHRKAFDSGYLEIPYFEEYPQIPLISWFAALAWQIVGVSLWPLRGLIIAASCMCIILIYKILKNFNSDVFFALVASAMFAFFPLSIFFGRNIQPEPLALLSMLCGNLYFFLCLKIVYR